MRKATHKELQTIAKLKQKKYRDEYGFYLASGFNTVETCLNEGTAHNARLLIREDNLFMLDDLNIINNMEILILKAPDFKRISDEKTPQGIALQLPLLRPHINDQFPEADTLIYLDRINDPGNLGTIARSALWFGFDTLLLSPQSIDPYNPKVIRAGVGYTTLTTIYDNISYSSLQEIARKNDYSICAGVLNGEPLQEFSPPKKSIIIFGSEAHGISSELYKISDNKLTIPQKGKGESLNLSTSAAIFLYYWANQ